LVVYGVAQIGQPGAGIAKRSDPPAALLYMSACPLLSPVTSGYAAWAMEATLF